LSAPSLQTRLAWRLGLVLMASMLLLAGVVAHYAWTTIDDLDDASLQVQAEQIVGYLAVDSNGARLALPEPLSSAYRQSGDAYLYVLLDETGKVLQASSDKARVYMTFLPEDILRRDRAFFRLPDSDGNETPYFALVTRIPGQPGLRVVVAQGHLHRDVFIDTLVSEFFEHIGWTLPLIMFSALAISLWTIRTSLKPVTALSARAARIGPQAADMRLPETGVPREIRSLVAAVNSALDRLEQGFAVQRQFTANAAHELRTPLAVLTARLDELEPSETVRQLSEDVARMNRLVAQLLRVSRLDAASIRPDQRIDLNELAADVVSYLAPLAIAHRREISLIRAPEPVPVIAAKAALEDALRNLVENALAHAPMDSEITVTVGSNGTLAVRDHGPGVPAELRERIFDRFWRGRGEGGDGAGLGLAIVRETARAHGGSVDVSEAEGGGAQFTLRLPPAPANSL
jgi:two-component system sensor histidine kinase TctE